MDGWLGAGGLGWAELCERGEPEHCDVIPVLQLWQHVATVPALDCLFPLPYIATGALPAGEDFSFADQVRPLQAAAPDTTRFVFATATIPEQVYLNLEEVGRCCVVE